MPLNVPLHDFADHIIRQLRNPNLTSEAKLNLARETWRNDALLMPRKDRVLLDFASRELTRSAAALAGERARDENAGTDTAEAGATAAPAEEEGTRQEGEGADSVASLGTAQSSHALYSVQHWQFLAELLAVVPESGREVLLGAPMLQVCVCDFLEQEVPAIMIVEGESRGEAGGLCGLLKSGVLASEFRTSSTSRRGWRRQSPLLSLFSSSIPTVHCITDAL